MFTWDNVSDTQVLHLAVIGQQWIKAKDERKWHDTLFILCLSFWLSLFATRENICSLEHQEWTTELALCANSHLDLWPVMDANDVVHYNATWVHELIVIMLFSMGLWVLQYIDNMLRRLNNIS